MKTIAILSQKGGAGKTTLALHLAVAAVQAKRQVAVVDLDPQASAIGWKDSRSGYPLKTGHRYTTMVSSL